MKKSRYIAATMIQQTFTELFNNRPTWNFRSFSGIPVAEQNLMFLEEELKDFHTLEDYNIKDSCTIRLSVGMKGGPINSRRTLYLDDKNTITEMAKILAVNDVSSLFIIACACVIIMISLGEMNLEVLTRSFEAYIYI